MLEEVLTGVVVTALAVLYWSYAYWEFHLDAAPAFYRKRRSFPVPPQWVLSAALVLTNATAVVWAALLTAGGVLPSYPTAGIAVASSLAVLVLIMVPTVLFNRPRFLISKTRQEEMRRAKRDGRDSGSAGDR